MKIFPFLICIALFLQTIACVSPRRRQEQVMSKYNKVSGAVDTDTNSVILTIQTQGSYPFNSGYKNIAPDTGDIVLANRLFKESIDQYITEHNTGKINFPGRYKRQLVFSMAPNEHRLAWVNCFCYTIRKDWRTEIIHVFDGGNCYFQVMIDLTEEKILSFDVNGEA